MKDIQKAQEGEQAEQNEQNEEVDSTLEELYKKATDIQDGIEEHTEANDLYNSDSQKEIGELGNRIDELRNTGLSQRQNI